jgi:hypothetical protein
VGFVKYGNTGLWSFQMGGTKLERFMPKNQHKVCPIENNTNLDSIFYLIKISKIDFIFLPASYLIISL